MPTKQIQSDICRELRKLFDPELVRPEWSVRRDATDAFHDHRVAYGPRLDIAIGPFNVSLENRQQDADKICRFNHLLVRRLSKAISSQNQSAIRENANPRCLIAIEIEGTTSSKHILGAMTNVSLLGRLGVLIGSTESIAKILRIREYASKLKEVRKARDDMFGNIACFEGSKFLELVRGPERRRPRTNS